jgi:hypothetical protein
MWAVRTREAKEIISKFEDKYKEAYQIRQGQPDIIHMDGYHLYKVTENGYQCCGTYGILICSSKSIKGLLKYL